MAKQRSFSMGNTLAFGNINDLNMDLEKPPVEPIKESSGSSVIKEEQNQILPADDSSKNPKRQDVESTLSKESKTTRNEYVTKKNTKSKEDSIIKKTSLRIQRSSLNYLAYASKLNNMNQNDYLAAILEENVDNSKIFKPDFNAIVEKRQVIDTVVKGIQIPVDILNNAKHQAALEMKSLSEYIDDILQKRMNEKNF